MIKSIKIDTDKCIHCGMCIDDCPVEIIEFDDNQFPKYVKDGDKFCVGCQHCMAICPSGALSFGDKNPDDSATLYSGNGEEVLQLIKGRRSFRKYKNESISKEKLNKIIEMLSFTPKGGNADNLYFSIVETKEKMDYIRNVTYEKILSEQNPTKFQLVAKQAFQKGKDIVYRGAPSMIAVAIDESKTIEGCETADPIIALSYCDLYAQSIGLGTVWCDMAVTIANEIKDVYSLLEIPSNYKLNYIMLFGEPSIRYCRSTQPKNINLSLLH